MKLEILKKENEKLKKENTDLKAQQIAVSSVSENVGDITAQHVADGQRVRT